MRRLVSMIVLVVLLGLGTAFADNIHDPIIDMEPGNLTRVFNGSASFTIFSTDAGCSDFNDTLRTCGTTSNFLGIGDSYGNTSGQNITSLLYVITTSAGNIDQGTFSAFHSRTSLFNEVQQLSPFSALYTGSTIFTHCTIGEGVQCDNSEELSEFSVGYAEVLVPKDGFATINIIANPVPEPSSVLLLCSGLGLVAARLKFKKN